MIYLSISGVHAFTCILEIFGAFMVNFEAINELCINFFFIFSASKMVSSTVYCF